MEYYVYIHRKKSDNSIFYVGKGSGVRAWDLVKRNELWKKVANKYGVKVEIYKKGMQEWYAYEIEKDLILKHGKISNKTGILTNITDGGDGGGSAFPCWKKDVEVRNYYNPATEDFFSGTRDDFKRKFGFSINPLFAKKNKQYKGWVKADASEEDVERVIHGTYGKFNPNKDSSIYKMINFKTGEVFIGTRVDFKAKFGYKLDALYSLKTKSKFLKGWYIDGSVSQEEIMAAESNYTGIYNPRTNKNKYELKHINGVGYVCGDRLYLQNTVGKHVYHLFCESSNALTHNGWYLLTKEAEVAKKYDIKEYRLTNKDGREFLGTIYLFRELYRKEGTYITDLMNGKAKSVLGWKIV